MSAAGSGPPWLAPIVAQSLAMTRAQALLLHGAHGDGVFECASAVATAWLCEGEPGQPRPCGRCAACHLVERGLHPDLHRLLPEALRADADDADKAGKRKPSRQIRIDEVRAAIDWIATTSSRGVGKVVLIHPAEAMNLQSASALLKTLEEPPAGARLLLTAEDPAALLPTVRSRVQVVRLPAVEAAAARGWLEARGVDDAGVLLAAAGGRPLAAAALAAQGVDARLWAALPRAVQRNDAAPWAGWPAARVLDALLKLCVDALAVGAGGTPRFFPAEAFTPARSMGALADWSRELTAIAARIEHPWHDALLVERLLARAHAAWTSDGMADASPDASGAR